MNLAIIPARKGSKGLKGKNSFPLCGRPLIAHTIDSALTSMLFDKVVVSTDDEEIGELAKDMGCSYHIRPERLATDEITLNEVIYECWKETESFDEKTYANVVTLQPTSPLRTSQHIREAFFRFNNLNADSLLSVREESHSLWETKNGVTFSIYNPKVNRQKAHPYYVGNGAIFITKRWVLQEFKERLGGKIELYVMNERDSLDIHTKEDIDLAEFYLRRAD